MSGAPWLRGVLARAFADAVAAIDVAARVRDVLASLASPAHGAVRIVAVGKAAPAMMRGALARFPDAALALVVAPDGVDCGRLPAHVEVHRAAHPLPDARSVAAAERVLRAVISEPGDLVVALVSGGASALLCAPYGITLDEKRALLQALLYSGADIRALNTVRRHLSRIKGGGLARAAAPARVHTLLLSDVIGGAAHDIGSGPTVADPTTCDDARAVLGKYAASFANLALHESLKPGDAAAASLHADVLLAPEDLALAVAAALRAEGFDTHVLPPSGDDVVELADAYARLAQSLAPGAALVRAAEPTVVVTRADGGRGGRSSHLAALVAGSLPYGVAFLAGASDGVDGNSSAAGAVVDNASFARAAALDALARFATADLHAAHGTGIGLLGPGPTGINLADVHVLARARTGSADVPR